MTSTLAFAFRGPIFRRDLPGLCARLSNLLDATEASIAFCDAGSVAADAVTVDALARLQLLAKRRRCQVRLVKASPELRELVAFMGLKDVLSD